MSQDRIQSMVSRTAARRVFHRRRFRRLRVGLRRAIPRSLRPSTASRPRRLEIVWLAHYQVTFRAESRVDEAAKVDVLVNGYERQAAVWDLSTVRWITDENGWDRFPPQLSETEARRIAHRALLQASLRHGKWGRHIDRWAVDKVRIVHYPFWAWYHEDRKGRLDVRMLDAVTGKQAGPAAKVALLAALKAMA